MEIITFARQHREALLARSLARRGIISSARKAIAQHAIHSEIDDMQIVEDLQLIVGHMCMQWLCANPVTRPPV